MAASTSSSFPPPYPSSDANLLLLFSHDIFAFAHQQQHASASSPSHLRVNPNFSSVPRSAKQLALLFEELLHEYDGARPMPRSASLYFHEILLIFHRLKILLHDRSARSRVPFLFRVERLTDEIQGQVVDLVTFLEILPLGELRISDDVRDLVRLLNRQICRLSPAIDPPSLALRRDALELIVSVEGGGVPDRGRMQGVFRRLGLGDSRSYRMEIERMEWDVADGVVNERWVIVMVALASIFRYRSCILFGASTP